MNMQNGLITHEHPLDVVYRDRVQQEKKLKEQTRMMQQRQMGVPSGANSDFMGGAGGQPLMLPGTAFLFLFALGKHDDPLIKAEIDKNIKEQRKLLEQDFARSIEEIDKNFELKKQEILKAN